MKIDFLGAAQTVTAGPSAGKSVITNIIQREFKQRSVVVPDAVSILFRGRFRRSTSRRSITYQQSKIYHVKVELEDYFRDENLDKVLVCNRGTLDGLAYWPSDRNCFFSALHTDLVHELKRYDYVIHLESATASEFDHTNPVRIESARAAEILDHSIEDIKSGGLRENSKFSR